MKAWHAGFLKGGNRKVKNARKAEVEGVIFDSQLEAHLFSGLKKTGIPFETQKSFELQPAFRYHGAAIRPIYIVVDFWIPSLNLLVDTKGFSTEKATMKWKMLKYILVKEAQGNPEPEIRLPKNKRECDSLVLELLSKTRK